MQFTPLQAMPDLHLHKKFIPMQKRMQAPVQLSHHHHLPVCHRQSRCSCGSPRGCSRRLRSSVAALPPNWAAAGKNSIAWLQQHGGMDFKLGSRWGPVPGFDCYSNSSRADLTTPK